MRYIKGRSNLSCTIFVPWDCKNRCKFCTSKGMYSERDKDMEAILAQIEKVNKNPLISELKSTINTVTKIGDLLKSFADLK